MIKLLYVGAFIIAKKGQKFKKYNNDEREKITLEYLNGKSSGYLSRKYNIIKNTIKTWERKFEKDGNTILNKKGRHKNRKIKIGE